MRIRLLVRSAVLATTATGALSVALAPLALADPSVGDLPFNYGQCVSNPNDVVPSFDNTGPANVKLGEHGEHSNTPPGQLLNEKDLYVCPIDPGPDPRPH